MKNQEQFFGARQIFPTGKLCAEMNYAYSSLTMILIIKYKVSNANLFLFFRCDIIPFDMTGNNNDTGATIDEKSNQWFGATVSSSGEDGVVVVRK